MSQQELYRWAGSELELIDLVVRSGDAGPRGERLRSLEGFEEQVDCLLQDETPGGDCLLAA